MTGTPDPTATPPAHDDRDEAPAPPATRRAPRWVLVGAVALGGLLLVFGAYGAVMWFRTDRVAMTLPGSVDGGTTYLLVGSDARTDVPADEVERFGTAADVPGRRADIVLAVRVMDDGTTHVLAIPRDLTVFRRGAGPERIAPMLGDGVGAVADGLCNSLGIGVDHAVVVEFDGLRELVDLAGGVEVTSDVALRDPMSGLSLPAGTRRLDGSQAIAYVRARTIETEVDGVWVPDDVRSHQRSERAMDVLEGLSGSLDMSWTDPLHVHDVLWTTTDAVQVDDGAGPGELMALRQALGRLRPDDLRTLAVDTQDGPVPTASLAPGAAAAVSAFVGADHDPACPTPVLLAP